MTLGNMSQNSPLRKAARPCTARFTKARIRPCSAHVESHIDQHSASTGQNTADGASCTRFKISDSLSEFFFEGALHDFLNRVGGTQPDSRPCRSPMTSFDFAPFFL